MVGGGGSNCSGIVGGEGKMRMVLFGYFPASRPDYLEVCDTMSAAACPGPSHRDRRCCLCRLLGPLEIQHL